MSIQERDDHVTAPGDTSSEPIRARAFEKHWTEATGTHLLVVDPACGDTFADALTSRGIHVTVVSSALDGLVEFGRSNPNVVIVAPDLEDIAAPELVTVIRRFGSPLIIAALGSVDSREAGSMMLAGATTAVTRPYTAEEVWGLLRQAESSLDYHARVSYGPIELDARAYTVRVNGERIDDLPLKEFEFLRALLHRAPEVVSNAELRLSLWGHQGAGPKDNALAVHAARIRHRLEDVATIRRIRAKGYSLTLR